MSGLPTDDDPDGFNLQMSDIFAAMRSHEEMVQILSPFGLQPVTNSLDSLQLNAGLDDSVSSIFTPLVSPALGPTTGFPQPPFSLMDGSFSPLSSPSLLVLPYASTGMISRCPSSNGSTPEGSVKLKSGRAAESPRLNPLGGSQSIDKKGKSTRKPQTRKAKLRLQDHVSKSFINTFNDCSTSPIDSKASSPLRLLLELSNESNGRLGDTESVQNGQLPPASLYQSHNALLPTPSMCPDDALHNSAFKTPISPYCFVPLNSADDAYQPLVSPALTPQFHPNTSTDASLACSVSRVTPSQLMDLGSTSVYSNNNSQSSSVKDDKQRFTSDDIMKMAQQQHDAATGQQMHSGGMSPEHGPADFEDDGSFAPGERKAYHKEAEQRRRDLLKNAIEGVRSVIPPLKQKNATRVMVLNAARDYIVELHSLVHKQDAELKALRKQS